MRTICVFSLSGRLCQADGLTVLNDGAGAALPDISVGGTIPLGENDRERIATSGRGIALQLSDSRQLLGRSNQLSLGATLDSARTQFFSDVQLGPIDAQLLVVPTNLGLDTPEGSEFSATPVSLQAVNQQVNFDKLRNDFGGHDDWERARFRDFFLEPIVSNAYKEAKGEAIVQGQDGG